MGGGACEADADCVGMCPAGVASCVCATTPMGDTCVPGCEADADCPEGREGQALSCREGVCRPNMMPAN